MHSQLFAIFIIINLLAAFCLCMLTVELLVKTVLELCDRRIHKDLLVVINEI